MTSCALKVKEYTLPDQTRPCWKTSSVMRVTTIVFGINFLKQLETGQREHALTPKVIAPTLQSP